MGIFAEPSTWISLLTLTFLEIVLGIDNILFISIVSGRLPESQQDKGRTIGLMLAMVFRIGLLISIKWILELTNPLFTVFSYPISVRDLILLGGGMFLIWKSTSEIHHKVASGGQDPSEEKRKPLTFKSAIVQIVLLDIVFSFDSILTAIGLTQGDNGEGIQGRLVIMICAVVISMIIMIAFAGAVADFVNKNPTLQVLALSFLIMIGVTLVMEAFHQHVEKGYVYASVAFSLVVEVFNMRMRKRNPKA